MIDTTDQLSHVTHNEYDAAGRLTAVTVAGERTAYTYYNDGRKHTETDPLSHTTTYNYDEAGRLTSTVDALNHTTTYGYDDAGNQISVTDADSHATHFEYDVRRRLKKTAYHDGTTVQNTYDGPGNLTGVTDQASRTVQYTFDLNNRLKTVVQHSNNTTAYDYDNRGNRTSTTDANAHRTRAGFDVLDQKTSVTLADGTLAQTSTYDSAGNLMQVVDFNGRTRTYTYDSMNRLLTGPGVTFTYTNTGKRATMVDVSGATIYTYDEHDHLVTKTTPQGTLNYTYNVSGKVASIAANGYAVSYAYDELNRLSTVTAGMQVTTYTYDPTSNVATVTYPNGVQSTFTYDSLNRMTARTGYTYQLGPTGNRQQASEPGGRVVNWTYDDLYRLTNEAITLDPRSKNGSVAYTMDNVGNRLTQTSTLSGIPTATFAYDNNDRVSTDTYDNNGNTLTSGARTFTYDIENRLVSSGAITIAYDGDGKRVRKNTTYYLVDDLNPTGYAQVIQEISGGAVTRSYVYGLQRISQTQNGTTSYYGYDGLGSVRTLTDTTGTVTDTYDYDAWGNIVDQTGSTPNLYLYRGEQYDSDCGVYYLRARYFNPLTGRFLTVDPAQAQPQIPATLHRYLYTGADPISKIDPSGQASKYEYTGVMAGSANGFGGFLGAQITAAQIFAAGVSTVEAGGILIAIYCAWSWADGFEELGELAANNSEASFPEISDKVMAYDGLMRGAVRAVNKVCRPSRPRGKCPPGFQDHHLLGFMGGEGPGWFGRLGIDIEIPSLHRCCPIPVHRALNYPWWLIWANFIATHPNGASIDEIMTYTEAQMLLYVSLYSQCTPLPGSGKGPFTY